MMDLKFAVIPAKRSAEPESRAVRVQNDLRFRLIQKSIASNHSDNFQRHDSGFRVPLRSPGMTGGRVGREEVATPS